MARRKTATRSQTIEAEAPTPEMVPSPPAPADGERDRPESGREVDTDMPRDYGPNPFGIRGDRVAGVMLAEDRRFRQMQLRFDVKPSDDIRKAVGEAGFQWRAAEKVWSKQIDPAEGWRTRVEAQELYEHIREILRAERGETRAVD